MARTADKIESLIADDSGMADALAVVYDRTDAGSERIAWADVNDELTSGQWGRLIEKDVLESVGDEFRLSDPDAVEAALDDEPTTTVTTTDVDTDVADVDADESSWTKWDKLAAVGAGGLFLGYSQTSVRDVVGGTVDIVLGPIDAVVPFYLVVLTVALLTGLFTTLLQANLMDMDKMSQYQERMKAIQEKRKEAKERGDDEALEQIRDEQMDAMGDQLGMFKEQFRPMVWTMFFTIPVFLWIYWMVLDGHVSTGEWTIVAPLIGEARWTSKILGPMQLWIVWYFLCSMSFTQLIRKSLNIQTTPT
ncbi:DUF106 domain-containing protein [Halorussus sp. MSC15.2]|uniref:DUF106 domain-containing protein n=1 Tax=Halorussus sp. MSC15.2 TaxID=2283638 RepID=UPI0013D85707|nr:DUF106 domain-containing protein [Halorussus sp. MSC15.2]NEU55859.1 DUF106 domain-containing protein [Halorussus sp. MSC15.2]